MRAGNKGFSLIEVMIALLITLVMSLALMQTALMSISIGMNNTIRDEAVSVAESLMNETRNLPFSSTALTGSAAGLQHNLGTITRNVRNTTFSFACIRTVTDIDTKTKRIDLSVTWTYRGVNSTHNYQTTIRDPNA